MLDPKEDQRGTIELTVLEDESLLLALTTDEHARATEASCAHWRSHGCLLQFSDRKGHRQSGHQKCGSRLADEREIEFDSPSQMFSDTSILSVGEFLKAGVVANVSEEERCYLQELGTSTNVSMKRWSTTVHDSDRLPLHDASEEPFDR